MLTGNPYLKLRRKLKALLAFTCLAIAAHPVIHAEEDAPRLIRATRIWERAPHNGFTDLVYFNGRFFCSFREGKSHGGSIGWLRIISSVDGEEWQSAAVLSLPETDMREAHFNITPEGKLMLTGGAHSKGRTRTLAWFSDNGVDWSGPVEVAETDFWIWKTRWRQEAAYGVGYGRRVDGNGKRFVRLFRSTDGKQYEGVAPQMFNEGWPTEADLEFLEDGTAICILRRDRLDRDEAIRRTAQFGVSSPPYTEWEWKDLGRRISCPDLLKLPDGRIVMGARLYEFQERVALCRVDPEKRAVEEFLYLPSYGDTAYTGMVWHDEILWVSYYSAHEGKACIYLARVKI